MIISRLQKRHRNGGQAMVEFALSFPFLLIILFSVLFFGQYFLEAQSILYAAQQGALVASRTPIYNSTTLDNVRGFTTGGTTVNTNSVIYAALNSAHLLQSGNLPPNANVEILPFDTDAAEIVPAGTVEVKINYPFQPFGIQFGNSLGVALTMTGNAGIHFKNFTLTERATAAQQIFQPITLGP